VVGVVGNGFEIEEQRRKAQHPERRGREDRGFEAMRRALAQHAARRPRRAPEVVRHGVEQALDAARSLDATENPELARGEAPIVQWVTGGSA
jgi:hypothetical protein